MKTHQGITLLEMILVLTIASMISLLGLQQYFGLQKHKALAEVNVDVNASIDLGFFSK